MSMREKVCSDISQTGLDNTTRHGKIKKGEKMKRKIQETHGSYMINLPREFANDLGLKRGDTVDFIVEKDKTIRMVPVDPTSN